MSSGPIHPDFAGSTPGAGEGANDPQPQPDNTGGEANQPSIEDLVRENEQLKKRYADSSSEAQRLVRERQDLQSQIRTLNAVVQNQPQHDPRADQQREALAQLEAAGIPMDVIRSVMADVATETTAETLAPIMNALQAGQRLGAEAQAIAESLAANPAMYETYHAIAAQDPERAEQFAREYHKLVSQQTPATQGIPPMDAEQAAIAQDAEIRTQRQVNKVQAQVVTPQSTSRTSGSAAAAGGVAGYSPTETEEMSQLYQKVMNGDQAAIRRYAKLRLFGGQDPVIPQTHLDGGFVQARPIVNREPR